MFLTTVDGCRLEADLALPDRPGGPVAGVVLAHPHPQYGGDRHNNVVDALFRTLHAAGAACIRFDFRGVGRSTGAHGGGVAERMDVEAALDELAGHVPTGRPLVLAGYSFGSIVALTVLDRRVAGWAAVAPPLATAGGRLVTVAADPRPKLVVLGAHDQFTPLSEGTATCQGWTATTVEAVANADHFFAGRAQVAADRVRAWVLTLAGRPTPR